MSDGRPGQPRRRAGQHPGTRSGWALVAVALVLVLLAGGALVTVSGVPGRGGGDGGGPGGASGRLATSLARVERRSLSELTQVSGTLGYAGSYTVFGLAQGTVTWLPGAGAVIGNGQVLYRVDGAPVVLLRGPAPAYRTLAWGTAAGADIAQLNRDLVALGYADRSAVDSPWDAFGWATAAGVQELQKHLGAAQTGELPLGAAVFLPTAARITGVTATLGGPAAGPVLTASSTRRTVRVALDVSLQSDVTPGRRVSITLPSGATIAGTVTSVGRAAVATTAPAAGAGGSGRPPAVPVLIRPVHPRAVGRLDQAPVLVAITGRTVRGVLAVPVDALLARPGGGYAVETVAGSGAHRLVRVAPGLFDDAAGLVQVSGPGLTAGQRVVVPGDV